MGVITGQKFGRLTALEPTDRRTPGSMSVIWLCECDCGNRVYVARNRLVTGNTKSCGCLYRERPNIAKVTTHGDSRKDSEYHRLYKAWDHMKSRCSNSHDAKYPDYGARGISVCSEWDDYISFKDWALNNGYNETLSIDRINNDGNYEPSNCRWTDAKTQMNNRRVNHLLTYNGETHTISEWSKILDLKYTTICHRLQLGWSDEEALGSKPSRLRKEQRFNND